MRRGCTLQTQADTLYIQPLLLQALKPQRQQLPHFGRCSMALHQHAPFALIDLPVSQMRPQWRGHQLGNSLRALLRQPCLLHQLAEHRRFFSGLFQRTGWWRRCMPTIMREPGKFAWNLLSPRNPSSLLINTVIAYLVNNCCLHPLTHLPYW